MLYQTTSLQAILLEILSGMEGGASGPSIPMWNLSLYAMVTGFRRENSTFPFLVEKNVSRPSIMQ